MSRRPAPAALPSALALFVLATALAGCVGEEPDPVLGDDGTPGTTDRPGQPNTPPAPPDATKPPSWDLYDHWTFENTAGVTVTFVVTGETPTDWIVDTTDDQYAFFDTAVDDSSSLGPQRKSDLAGSEGSDRVLFFQWPLVDGASWKTMWDSEERTVTATALDGSNVFLMEARSADGSLYATYEYDPAVGWFRTFDFYDPDGSMQFGHMLVDNGHDWTGEVVRYESERIALLHHHGDTNAAPAAAETIEFTVDEGQEVFLLGGVACTAGAFHFQVAPQDAPTEGHTTQVAPCPGTGSFFGAAGTTPGAWRLTLAFAGTPGDAFWLADAFLRTRVPITIG